MRHRINTPKRLMTYAAEGKVSKAGMASVLAMKPRNDFLRECAKIERQYTVECAAQNDPCLESGCSAEGEICLAPLIRAGSEYKKACAVAWQRLFVKAENRVCGWEADVAGWDV